MSELALELIQKAKKEHPTYLEIGNCELTELPDVLFEELPDLETLIVSNRWREWNGEKWIDKYSKNNGKRNLFSRLHPRLKELRNLKKLVFGGYYKQWQISDLSPIANLVNLEHLNVGYNQIQKIENLDKLLNLQYLYLRNNQIQKIENLDKLLNLQYLYLSSNQIQKIEKLDKLLNLQYLYLSSNQIQKIENLDKLLNLQYLDLYSNQIQKIENLDKLLNLQYLYLYSNQIQKIENLDKLLNLQYLYLSSNQIQKIEKLDKLLNLQYLYLSSNQIQKIENLDKLLNLQYLDLYSNQIQKIENLDKLLNLQSLDLESNQVQDLYSLKGLFIQNKLKLILKEGELPKKGEINIYDNPITTPPLEIVEQGNDAVIRWLEDAEKEEQIPLREAKLLIIGAGGVGKTSLMTKLKDVDADLPKEDKTTVGIDVVQTPVPLSIDNENYTLNIWDFGGQDVYHPTHQFFLTKNSLYVLMEDGREKKTDFYYWLQVQELLAGNSPLLIVQNIKHGSATTIPFNDLKGKFHNIQKSYDIDLSQVKTGYKDFERIVDQLKVELKGLPHIGDVWLKNRYEIREALTARKQEQYISLKEYYKVCESFGFDDPNRQGDLLEQLHYLGTVLHFKGEPLLEDIVIINPQWATDAVYAILDHTAKHKEKKGVFTWRDLQAVWHEAKYKDCFFEILALMEKFELAFELRDKRKTYIAPLLLPDDKPNYSWDASTNLQMIYRYDFLPKGILARLIVRLHDYLKDELFWKRGVIFEDNDCEAEVVEDYTRRSIHIRVRGTNAKSLASMISSTLDKINGTYHFSDKIRAIKFVPCDCKVCETNEKPHFYKYNSLKTRLQKGKKTVECDISYADVPVQRLLDNIYISVTAEINKLIADNRIEDCFTLLEKRLSIQKLDQLLLLKGDWKKNKDDNNSGTIDKRDYDLKCNKIRKALLTLARENEL